MPEYERALVVGAHPDDCELFAGGTVAGWIRNGTEVHFLILTDGRLGSHDPAVDPDHVADVRAREARRAGEFLGATGVGFGGFPDGALSSHLGNATVDVALAIRALRPDVVLGHDPWRPYEPHPDHRAAGTATCDGAIAARESHALPPSRAGGLGAHRPRTVLLMGTGAPNRFVDVTDDMEAKLNALAFHASQFAHVDAWRSRVETWNARIGAARGYRFAEAFHSFG